MVWQQMFATSLLEGRKHHHKCLTWAKRSVFLVSLSIFMSLCKFSLRSLWNCSIVHLLQSMFWDTLHLCLHAVCRSEDVDVMISEAEHIKVLGALKEMLYSICDYAHDRCVKVMTARAKVCTFNTLRHMCWVSYFVRFPTGVKSEVEVIICLEQ